MIKGIIQVVLGSFILCSVLFYIISLFVGVSKLGGLTFTAVIIIPIGLWQLFSGISGIRKAKELK